MYLSINFTQILNVSSIIQRIITVIYETHFHEKAFIVIVFQCKYPRIFKIHVVASFVNMIGEGTSIRAELCVTSMENYSLFYGLWGLSYVLRMTSITINLINDIRNEIKAQSIFLISEKTIICHQIILCHFYIVFSKEFYNFLW